MNCNNKICNDICFICRNEYRYFFNHYNNVVGVGLGYKVKNGFNTNRKCIMVFVTRKLPLNQLLPQQVITPCYKGFPTDVVESGVTEIAGLTNKVRPVICGYGISLSTHGALAGSSGCLVTDGINKYILSNNHIIANGNKARINSPILQPTRLDGGVPGLDVVASLAKFVPIRFETKTESPENYADCAIARLINPNIAEADIYVIGKPRGANSAKLREAVQKSGRKTGYTVGIVRALAFTSKIGYENKKALFKDLIVTTKMGDKGDSGAVLVNGKKEVIGLYFAQGKTFTYFNNIQHVLSGLNVRIVTN